MKRIYLIGFVFLTGLLVSCQDTIPFRYPLQSDSLATREYPHAFFIVEGKIVDSLTQEPVPCISVYLRLEEPVFTDDDGIFRTQTIAFPISQEFRLIFNAYGEHFNPLYEPETLYVHFMLPTFQLTREEILEYGPQFFGSTYMTVNKILTPLEHD
ncbi:MAG: hypothetical protein WCQ69_03230 [Bacteroidales bacterium]|jgi:hypothetical protein|nr:carboxypeptidase-like regulatory domain-containing protein [Bacteroidales bacterium]MDD2263515.1 hypothetical protein [Bacteroidales bacterium]MDD2830695.1 hypothetical protein [Bacteroidales bacterium]MDD3207894.1 hypothetical protein [Bacteroidales bacterium]MDD3696599.1 hypothetical protein [Bacteroidales bacterium]